MLFWGEHKVDVEEALVCMKTHVFSPGRVCEREKTKLTHPFSQVVS